jgi:hypothetical protein
VMAAGSRLGNRGPPLIRRPRIAAHDAGVA